MPWRARYGQGSPRPFQDINWIDQRRRRRRQMNCVEQEQGDVEEEHRQEQCVEMKVEPVVLSCYCNGS